MLNTPNVMFFSSKAQHRTVFHILSAGLIIPDMVMFLHFTEGVTHSSFVRVHVNIPCALMYVNYFDVFAF